VLGQSAAIEVVEHALVVAQAGLQNHERPLSSLLLVGPTGVGKTEMVRGVAAETRNGPDDLCRIDMGQLSREHYAASLAGAPPGYAGSREGSSLYDKTKVEGTPLTPGIVLFDEIEKAHKHVLRALLGALDHGDFVLANGEQAAIFFRNTLVFMTSNLGSAEVAKNRAKIARRTDAASTNPLFARPANYLSHYLEHRDVGAVERAVRNFFKPEFLNRLDEIAYFDELSTDIALEIVELRIRDALASFHRREIDVAICSGVDEALVDVGFDPVNGARSLGRAVRRHLVVPVAEALVAHRRSSTDQPLRLQVSAALPASGDQALIVRRLSRYHVPTVRDAVVPQRPAASHTSFSDSPADDRMS
jgi:ATP-dependent Clp protease ATP-binding subunit ClpA